LLVGVIIVRKPDLSPLVDPLFHLLARTSSFFVTTPPNNTEMDLEQYRIPGLPASFYYIPNFITVAEEAALLSKARSRDGTSYDGTLLTHR
jgi:hypothetical protein